MSSREKRRMGEDSTRSSYEISNVKGAASRCSARRKFSLVRVIVIKIKIERDEKNTLN